MTLEEQLKTAVEGAQRCQRNWDLTKTIPQEHIDLLLKVATTSPTKQNKEWYQLVYTTDRNIIEKLYSIAYEPRDSEYEQKLNTQVRAHMVMIWLHCNEKTDDLSRGGEDYGESINQNSREENVTFNAGISSGIVSLTANMLGYRTGFCQCVIEDELQSLIQSCCPDITQGKINGGVLGIGIPRHKDEHHKVYDSNDEFVGYHARISIEEPKNITVTRLQK